MTNETREQPLSALKYAVLVFRHAQKGWSDLFRAERGRLVRLIVGWAFIAGLIFLAPIPALQNLHPQTAIGVALLSGAGVLSLAFLWECGKAPYALFKEERATANKLRGLVAAISATEKGLQELAEMHRKGMDLYSWVDVEPDTWIAELTEWDRAVREYISAHYSVSQSFRYTRYDMGGHYMFPSGDDIERVKALGDKRVRYFSSRLAAIRELIEDEGIRFIGPKTEIKEFLRDS